MAIELLSALRLAVVAALPVSPAKGDTVVLAADGHLWTYDGATWIDNGASGGGGGGGAVSGFLTIDFGVGGGQLAELTVVDPTVSLTTVFVGNLQGSTVDNSAFVHSIIPATTRFDVDPGVGYTVRVRSDWKVFGTVKV